MGSAEGSGGGTPVPPVRVEGGEDASGAPLDLYVGADGRLGRPPERAARVVDATGLRVEPGFVDLQVNGGFGHDLTADPTRVWEVGSRLAAHGVTAFLPTLVSASVDEARAADDVLVAGPPDGWSGAVPVGLHLEGPALAPEHRGVHPAERLARPDQELVGAWLALRTLRLVTLAPELPGARAAIRRLTRAGVRVGIGHTGATEATTRGAVDAGATLATHLFNAMAPFHHRRPGVVGTVLTDGRVAVGLIADGVHVAPEAIALAWMAAGADRVVLTGDPVAALGADLDAARTGDGALAGGTTPFPEVRRRFLAAVGLEGTEPRVTSTNACRVLGLEDRGTLRAGARADLVLLDGEGRPIVALVSGRVVHDPEGRLSSR